MTPVALTTGATLCTSGALKWFSSAFASASVRLGAGTGAEQAAERRRGGDRQHVGAERIDLRLDGGRGAGADCDQHDHRADADHQAEDRQPRAQLVGGEAGERDREHLAHATASCRSLATLVGDDAPVADADDPARVGGDLLLVGDQDDRAALVD